MPGLRLSVQWFHRGYQAVLRVDAEEPLNVCVLRDHVPRRTGNVNRPLCSEELNRVCFFSPAGVLPDRVDGDVGVLGVDSSHNGARRRVLLYLKRVAGSYEHRRLVCILHRNLHTQERRHFLKHNCYIYPVTHTNKHSLSSHAAWHKYRSFKFQNTMGFFCFFMRSMMCVPLLWLHPYRAPKQGIAGQCGGLIPPPSTCTSVYSHSPQAEGETQTEREMADRSQSYFGIKENPKI